MIGKVTLILLGLTALASANPAANTDWTWEIKRLSVTPNPKSLPFKQLIKESYTKRDYTPGTRVVADCGRNKYNGQEKIVGGTEALPNSWPWQVGLFIDDLYFCGGSIIDSNWVLTAAHCVEGSKDIDIVAGAHNIQQNEPTQATYRSTDYTMHEDWNSFFLRNDIALIFVPGGIEFTPEIQPVCLPASSQADLGAGVSVILTGWGRTSDDTSGISDTLQQITVPTITNVECADVYPDIIVTDDIVCTSGIYGIGTCNGDTGGPLNYDIGGGVYCTEGITSFGAAAGNCESGYPDAFTRLTRYTDWIAEKTGIAIPPFY